MKKRTWQERLREFYTTNHSVPKVDKGEGVQKSENFTDVINGSSLTLVFTLSQIDLSLFPSRRYFPRVSTPPLFVEPFRFSLFPSLLFGSLFLFVPFFGGSRVN